MSFSYGSLQDFHRFIVDGYNYDKADEKMYVFYRLYSLLSDGIGELSHEEIDSALKLASEFAKSAQQLSIIQNLYGQRDYLIRTDIQSFLSVIRYTTLKYDLLSEEYRTETKGLLVDKVLFEFLANQSDESEFGTFYNEVSSLCQEHGFSVASELMRAGNREKLFAGIPAMK